MGRTNPTYRNFLESYETDWAPFRRALRRRHRADFDRLFERAARHAAAAGFQNPPDPTEALVLSLLVAHETELRRLRERVGSLEAHTGDSLDADVEDSPEGEGADAPGADAAGP